MSRTAMPRNALAVAAALVLLYSLPVQAEMRESYMRDGTSGAVPYSSRALQQDRQVAPQPNLASGTLEKREDLRGDTVAGAAGGTLGTVTDVVGSASGQGRYLVINTGAGEMPYLPVPEHQFLRIADGRLQLRTLDALVVEAPRYAVSDFAKGPDGWPEALEMWWRERLQLVYAAAVPLPPGAAPPGAAAPGPEAYGQETDSRRTATPATAMRGTAATQGAAAAPRTPAPVVTTRQAPAS